MNKLTLFVGVRNSGKSAVAEQFALGHYERPTYCITLPTCSDFAARILRHRERRSGRWVEVDLVVPHEQSCARLAERAARDHCILVDGLAALFWAQFSLFGRTREELVELGRDLALVMSESSAATRWVLVDCPVPLPQQPGLHWFNDLVAEFYHSLREALPHEVIYY